MAGRVAYYGGIVKDGLVLDLDAAKRDSYPGTGTTWRDISGNQNNGTLTNGPTFNSTNGGSISFNSGSIQYVNCGNSTSLNSSNITFTAWVQRTTTWTQTALFWAKANGNFASNGFYVELSTSSSVGGGFTPTTVITNGSANNYFRTSINSNTSFPLNTWTYFTFTLNGNTPAMYFNGIAASLTIGGINAITPTSDTKYLMYSSPGYNGATNGTVSTTQIYNRALTAQEVLQNYNATKGRYGL